MTGSPPKLKRRWLRFSLRTLLLFVLLIASAATLWWNWGPWRLAFRVEEPGPIMSIHFSDDDRFVMFHYVEERDPATRARLNCLDIRSADTGERHALLMNPVGTDAAVNGEWAMLYAANWWGQAPSAPVIRLYDWRAVREFDSSDKFMQQGDIPTHAYLEKNHVLVPFRDRSVLYKLPEFSEQSWPAEAKARIIGEGWLAAGAEPDYEETELRELATGRTFKAPEGTKNWQITVRNRCILFQKGDSEFIVLDTQSGATIKGKANVLDVSPDGKYILASRVDADTMELREIATETCLLKIDECHEAMFSPDGRFIMDQTAGRLYDVIGRNLLWQAEGATEFASGGEFTTIGSRIFDTLTGRQLIDLQAWRTRADSSAHAHIILAHHTHKFAAQMEENTHDGNANSPDRKWGSVWCLRRPWQWYGVGWLPEFWITMILAIALLWSVASARSEKK